MYGIKRIEGGKWALCRIRGTLIQEVISVFNDYEVPLLTT